MKTKDFEKSDGTQGVEYKPEHGDKVLAKAESVFASEPRAVIVGRDTDKERAVNITTYGISAEWEGKEIFCKLTQGHQKLLSQKGNLMGKTLVFANYESDKWGTLVGVSVAKD
jgi:hypothetical protein